MPSASVCLRLGISLCKHIFTRNLTDYVHIYSRIIGLVIDVDKKYAAISFRGKYSKCYESRTSGFATPLRFYRHANLAYAWCKFIAFKWILF